ncbi:nucleotide-diphospho-sugar transferase [Xylogone sp. PMI_703]|nr:nucleotide-diphospho-sugar transferase [Xylogone sp. PMI_703]
MSDQEVRGFGDKYYGVDSNKANPASFTPFFGYGLYGLIVWKPEPNVSCNIRLWKNIPPIITHLASQRLQPVPLPDKPSFIPSNVSVVIPTISPGSTFKESLLTMVANQPTEIIIVTTVHFKELVQEYVTNTIEKRPSINNSTTIKLISTSLAGKRRQLAQGIKEAQGSIIVLADDDVFWPPKFLQLVLACFENPKAGGVGTMHRGRLPFDKNELTVWERLAAFRLRWRNKEMAAVNYLDNGAVLCLSGRTADYRADILKSPSFIHAFTNDYWLDRFQLDSGDDNFITRWLLSANWDIKIQVHPEAELTTNLEPTPKFLHQSIRWQRNATRGLLRLLFFTPKLWFSHPVLLLRIAHDLLYPFCSMLEWYILVKLFTEISPIIAKQQGLVMYVSVRVLLISYDLLRCDSFTMLLVGYLFKISHTPLGIYALLTLHVTSWGSRNLGPV